MANVVPINFGSPVSVGTTTLLIGQGVAGHRYTLRAIICSSAAADRYVSLWVATAAWTSGVPVAGGTLVATAIEEAYIPLNSLPLIVPVVLEGTQKLLAKTLSANVAIVAAGIDSTL